MAEHIYRATVSWRRGEGDFAKGRYSRGHVWRFDGGIDVTASASPQVVPKPYAVEAAVDPEEAFVASLSSCHMLTFIDLARRAGFVVDAYEDEAEGVMEKNAHGKYWVSRVTLQPRITWSGEKQPSHDDLARLHHSAHEECFIANSVKTDVTVEGF
ncbi:MAG TPA: OsmC family protein [Bauldia sp.]|nr:OsmC family protein [Bauldia sp.]